MVISKNKSIIFAVIDFNCSRSDSGNIPPRSFRGESSHELGFHGLRPAPVPSAPTYVSQIRQSVPGALSGSNLLLLGSIHRDGVRPVDRARQTEATFTSPPWFPRHAISARTLGQFGSVAHTLITKLLRRNSPSLEVQNFHFVAVRYEQLQNCRFGISRSMKGQGLYQVTRE